MNEEFLNLKRFKEYFDELYGKGLYVAGWHMNGNLEPFDSFYESAIENSKKWNAVISMGLNMGQRRNKSNDWEGNGNVLPEKENRND